MNIEGLPFELVERIASFLPAKQLKDFRLVDRKCAATGLKPLIKCVPSSVRIILDNPRPSGSKQKLTQLSHLPLTPAIAKIITSLRITGTMSAPLSFLPTLHLPNLSCFRLERTAVTCAKNLITFSITTQSLSKVSTWTKSSSLIISTKMTKGIVWFQSGEISLHPSVDFLT